MDDMSKHYQLMSSKQIKVKNWRSDAVESARPVRCHLKIRSDEESVSFRVTVVECGLVNNSEALDEGFDFGNDVNVRKLIVTAKVLKDRAEPPPPKNATFYINLFNVRREERCIFFHNTRESYRLDNVYEASCTCYADDDDVDSYDYNSIYPLDLECVCDKEALECHSGVKLRSKPSQVLAKRETKKEIKKASTMKMQQLLYDVISGNEEAAKSNCVKAFSTQSVSDSILPSSLSAMALLKDYRSLMYDSNGDIVIKVGQKEFSAHKNILSARSPVFKAMFSHDVSETRSGQVEIIDFDADAVESFLHYIYTGVIKDPNKHMLSLLAMADKYNVSALSDTCADILEESIKADNCIEILMCAHSCKKTSLKQAALRQCVKERKTLRSLPGYKQLEKQASLLTELFVFDMDRV